MGVKGALPSGPGPGVQRGGWKTHRKIKENDNFLKKRWSLVFKVAYRSVK